MKVLSIACCVVVLLSRPWRCSAEAPREGVTVRLNGRELRIGIPVSATSSTNTVEWLIAQAVTRELVAANVKAAGITVSEKALTNCVNLYFAAGRVSPETAEIVRQRGQLILDALKDVVLRKKDKSQVYQRKLRGSVSPQEWDVWVSEYNTKERLEELERAVPGSLAEMKRVSQQSLKRDLETWLLFDHVTSHVTPSGDDIMAVYRKLYPSASPPLTAVRKEVVNQATAQLRQERLTKWWKEEVSKQSIEVPKQYQGALNLIGSVPRPLLPESVVDFLHEHTGKRGAH